MARHPLALVTPRAAAPLATSARPHSRAGTRLVLSSASAASYYDAASPAPRDADWGAWSTTILEDLRFDSNTRRIALARLRREVRNNPYLAGLVAKYPEAVGRTLLRSRTSDAAYNAAKELFWWRWQKHATADGRSLRQVEKLLCTEDLLAGELFTVLLASGRVQLIASEFCGSPYAKTRFADAEINGIVYADSGAPLYYRFGRMDRSGVISWTGKDEELVEARNVIHYFDPDRILQGRGLPRLLPSVKTARDLYEITRAKTKQIKDVTAISGAIEKENARSLLDELAASQLAASSGNTAEDPDDPADRQDTTSAEPLKIELAPGTFVFLEPGEKLHQLVNKYEADDYKELIMLMLHAIASPVGLPVELWFSGLGDVNYSGFKGLGVQWKSRRAHICEQIEEAHHDRLHFWRISKAARERDLPPNPDGDDELIAWGWRRSAVLDDEKAATANARRLESGEADLAEIWEENGKFPEEVLARRRLLYIAALRAAGQVDETTPDDEIEVPLEFLLRGTLPGAAPAAAPAEDPPAEDPDAPPAEDPEDPPAEDPAAA